MPVAVASLAIGGLMFSASIVFTQAQLPRRVAHFSVVTLAFLAVVSGQIAHQEWVREAPEVSGVEQATIRTDHREAVSSRGKVMWEAKLAGFVERTETGDGWVQAGVFSSRGTVPVLLWFSQDTLEELDGAAEVPSSRWVPGMVVRFDGSFRPSEPQRSTAYMVSVQELTVVESPAAWHRVIASLRLAIIEHASVVDGADLVPGFTVGDTSLVTEELDAAMKTTSLTHLIAVSGANCALIVAAAMVVVSHLGVGRRLRIGLGALALFGFTLIVGPDPSIQRAALMAAVTLLSQFGGRRGVGFASLGCAMTVLLIGDPWQARHPGFTLSVAATAGIMFWAPGITRWLSRWARLPMPLALTLAVTIAAQVACGPLLLLLQPGLALGGILANVLAAPAAPLGTGIGLLAMLAAPVAPLLGHWLTVVAAVPSSWVVWLALTIAEMPLTRLYWPGGAVGAVLLTLCQGSIIASLWLRSMRPVGRWRTRIDAPVLLRRLWWVFGAAGVGTFVAVSITSPVMTRVTTPGDWFVVMCDVGQGDAFLVRDPADPDRVMLTDTGVDETAVSACLDRFSVTEVTLLVLTHDDADHVGGMGAVLDRTRAALISRPVTGDSAERAPEQQLQRHSIPYRIGVEGMQGTLGSDSPDATLSWRILAPTTEQPITSANGASIVMRIDVQGVCLFMLADTGETDHAMLRSRYPDERCDIVKAAHHGSKDAEAELLEQLGAEYGLVSSGVENRYGHPSDKTLDDLARAKTIPLRSDTHGSIALSLQGDRVVVWSER